MQPMTPHKCWCVAFLRADGSPAGRFEYFKTEERAKQYTEGGRRNGANLRYFAMVEADAPSTEAA